MTGTYKYGVRHYYGGSATIASSGVEVKVYDVNGLKATYNYSGSSCNNGSDDFWYIFNLDGDTGNITNVNTCHADTNDGLTGVME